MKKRLATILLLAFTATSLVACGSSSNVAESTADTTVEELATTEPTATPELTEAPHEHAYVETITTEATCETDGEATYTCECGDSYTEPITAVGHVFENYTSNNDATYTADGTETAKCNNCDVTDTRTAEGSMLTYTYTDMDATMYAQKTVNVRSLPNTDGEKLGSLSTNDEVKVTGQCAETSWYRIEYNGGVAYVSNSYLGNDKVVVQAEAPAQSSTTSISNAYEAYDYATSQGYALYQATDNGDGTASFYYLNINAVLPSDQSDYIGNQYSAAWDAAYVITNGNSGLFYQQYDTSHVTNLGGGWSIRRFTCWAVEG